MKKIIGIYEILIGLMIMFFWFSLGLPKALCTKDFIIPLLAILTTPLIVIIFVLLVKNAYKNLTTKNK